MNDALLVAWIDGEVTDAERELVERAIAADDRVRAKVELLKAARRELHEALQEDDAVAVPGPARRRFLPWLAAAAAALVVVAIAASRRGDDTVASASNDLLEVRLVPVRDEWPMFSGVRFRLEGRAKTSRFFGPEAVLPCRIMTRLPGESDAAAAARLLPGAEKLGFVPLVLDAEVVLPDGTLRRGPVARGEGEFGATWTGVGIELLDVVTKHPAIPVQLEARPLENGWAEDFVWCFRRAGQPEEVGGSGGFVAEEPGAYVIRFSLRSFAPRDDGRFPTFAEPLVVETKFAMRGSVGPWSEPVDGLSARIVASSHALAIGESFAFALQLRNDSDRPRAYNVAGITMAKVPQPFHFDLLVDGERWTQREDMAVVFSGGSSFLPQPAGTARSVIVLADFWRRGGKDGPKLSSLSGRHSIALRFHFEPTLWGGDPRDLWQGEVETPPIAIEVGGR